MYKSFLFSYRFIHKNKLYFLINLIGLIFCYSASFLIIIYTDNQGSYNKFHEQYDRIYRVITNNQDFEIKSPGTPFFLSRELQNTYPEIEFATTIKCINLRIRKGDGFILEKDFQFVDKSFLNIFSVEMINGNSSNPIKDLHSIAISQSMSEKYFMDNNPVGQIITIIMNNREIQLKVEGVFKDMPWNSTLKTNFLCNNQFLLDYYKEKNNDVDYGEKWKNDLFETYILVKKNVNVSDLDFKVSAFFSDFNKDSINNISYYLQSLSRVYLFSDDLVNSPSISGNPKQVLIFTSVMSFIILITCINFITLIITQSRYRAKEFFVKRVIGSSNSKIAFQLIKESLLYSLIALPISFVIGYFLIPNVEDLFGMKLYFNLGNSSKIITKYISIAVFITLFVGMYLFHYLHKDFVKKSGIINDSAMPRLGWYKPLFVFQSIVFSVLLIFIIFVKIQLLDSMTSNLGFNSDGLIIIPLDKATPDDYQSFKNKIANNTYVTDVTGALFVPQTNSATYFKIPRFDDEQKQIITEYLAVDYDFIKTLNLQIISGRSFIKEMRSDLKDAIIINELAIEKLGISEPVIGKEIIGKKIIGVIKDFRMHSTHKEIIPLAIVLDPKNVRNIIIRIDANNEANSLNYLEKEWANVVNKPFNGRTLSNFIIELYEEELKFSTIIQTFTILAIILVSLGLLGVSFFIAEKKIKEIGIRKIHGATSIDLTYVFLKDFVILTIVANLISWPLTYMIITRWLQNFAYSINIIKYLWVFPITLFIGLIIIFICLLNRINWVTKVNPIDSLRIE